MENETKQINVSDEDAESFFNKKSVEVKQNGVPTTVDLQNKMAIIYKVLKVCLKERTDNVYYYREDFDSRLAYLTNLDESLVSGIILKAKEPKHTQTLDESVLETPDMDLFIRQLLIKYYLTDNIIPRYEFLKKIVKNRYGFDIHKQLKVSGYIWHRLPNTKRAIIMEHPKRSLERQRYLQQIIRFRKEKRHIIYVESKILTKADKDIVHFQHCLTEFINYVVLFIAVSNKHGFMGGPIFVSKTYFKCKKLIEDHFLKNYLPKLTESSVIILEDKLYYTKSLPIPTIESEKSEMIQWLSINGIPHEENLHRSELFQLIERCKSKRDLHNFDAKIHAHGHEILRRPSKTDYLNYYKPLWEKLSAHQDVIKFITKQTFMFWRNLETILDNMEKKVYFEDLKVENIIDRILTMAKNVNVTTWADEECDEEEDSLTLEEFIIEHRHSSSQDEINERERQFLLEINKFDTTIDEPSEDS